MKLKYRLIYYFILAIVYWFATYLLLDINYNIIIPTGFSIINIVYAFAILRWKTFLNLIIGLSITLISFFTALKIGDLEPFPNIDPYGIMTAIISNILLSILLWEISHKLKKSAC